MIRVLFISLIIVIIISNKAIAEIIPAASYQQVIDLAMKNYWGKARLKDGSYVMPESEKDKATVPITIDNAKEVIQAGELSSLADWCGLNWNANYLRVTSGARSYGLAGKQVAFVGLLHGVSMGVVNGATKGKECTPDIKEKIKAQLRDISNKSINFAPSEPDDAA